VHSPAWMIAYAVVLALLGITYTALVFSSPKIALVFALAALMAVVVSLALALKR
jgi:hypothetical protein